MALEWSSRRLVCSSPGPSQKPSSPARPAQPSCASPARLAPDASRGLARPPGHCFATAVRSSPAGTCSASSHGSPALLRGAPASPPEPLADAHAPMAGGEVDQSRLMPWLRGRQRTSVESRAVLNWTITPVFSSIRAISRVEALLTSVGWKLHCSRNRRRAICSLRWRVC
eukprot:scaffold503_cov375-Pinguiococcus_pyrenoidosus.AAC.18